MEKTGNVKTLQDRTVLIVDGVKFRWNNAYHVYNSDKDYHQLTWGELRASRAKEKHQPRKHRGCKPRLTR